MHAGTELEDTSSSLIRGLQQDGEAAWARAYNNYAGIVYRFAQKWTGSHVDAEDITQETFAVLCDRIREFVRQPGRPSFRAWLYAICRHKIQEFQRAKRKERDASDSWSREGADISILPDDAAERPDVIWERTWYQGIYRDVLKRLFDLLCSSQQGMTQYKAFCLRFQEGMSYKEVWEELNAETRPGSPEITFSMVKNYIFRTRQLFTAYAKDALREYCRDEEELKQEMAAFLSFLAERRQAE